MNKQHCQENTYNINELNVGTIVSLNKDGQECYERNKKFKNIPTTDKLVVKDNYASYDDKGVIVQVTDMNGEKTDNYYACHLIIVKQI